MQARVVLRYVMIALVRCIELLFFGELVIPTITNFFLIHYAFVGFYLWFKRLSTLQWD